MSNVKAEKTLCNLDKKKVSLKRRREILTDGLLAPLLSAVVPVILSLFGVFPSFKLMDSVQKMVLVEPRVFENMKERQHEEYPLVSAMSSLDVEMNAVISGSNLPTEDKARLYDP